MTLDTATLATVAFTIGITLTFNLTLLCVLMHRPRPLTLWTLAFWALTLGSLCEDPTRWGVSATWALLPPNGLISLANALLLMGFAAHLGYPLRWRWPLALVAGYVVTLAACLAIPAMWDKRVIVLSVHSIIWDAWIVWLLITKAPHGLQASAALTALVFLADMVFYGVRGYLLSRGQLAEMSGLADTLLSTNYLFGTLTTMLVVIGLMTMQAQKMMRELRHAADHDALSGLPNRAMFTRLATRAIARCDAENQPYVVMLCDLDGFKAVNDQWGHGVGDLALKHFSLIIRVAGLPRTALFSRYGGEEFAVLLPGSDKEEASVLAERLRQKVEQTPVQSEDGMIPLTVSIGAVIARGLTYAQALEAADEALYAAKHAGRNRVVWSDDVHPAASTHRDEPWLQPQSTPG